MLVLHCRIRFSVLLVRPVHQYLYTVSAVTVLFPDRERRVARAARFVESDALERAT